MSYWTQFSFDEIKAMQGRDDDTNLQHDEDDTNSEQEDVYCKSCRDRGCSSCLL